ncbi:MAG: DsbE family thiol:disulfide interchange protein [Sphingomonadaceae bacterium]
MTAHASKTPSRWALWLPLVLFCAFVALVLYGLLRPGDRDIKSAMIGKPLPQFSLRAASDERPGLSFADMADGKPRLLNVFASWCVPCAAEAPQLAQLRALGVDVVGIAIRDRPDELKTFLQRNGNPFSRIGADDVSAIQFAIGSSGVPESFVIDGKGVIRYQHIGDIRPEQVEMIAEKVREAGQ